MSAAGASSRSVPDRLEQLRHGALSADLIGSTHLHGLRVRITAGTTPDVIGFVIFGSADLGAETLALAQNIRDRLSFCPDRLPSGVLTLPGRLSRADADRLRGAWKAAAQTGGRVEAVPRPAGLAAWALFSTCCLLCFLAGIGAAHSLGWLQAALLQGWPS